jgi:glucose-6-phosphate 1-epimerase
MIKEFSQGEFEFIELESEHLTLLMTLHGAQIISIQPKKESEDWLWISGKSRLTMGKALRGGIPLCWPVFGADLAGKMPKHGLARTAMWRLKGEQDNSKDPAILLSFVDSPTTQGLWPHAFRVELAIRLSDHLEMELRTFNTGDQPFTYSESFHTYFAISHLNNVAVSGLKGLTYYDALVDGDKGHVNNLEQITVNEEYDRSFLESYDPVTLIDSGYQRRFVLEREGSGATTVWNPHATRSAQLSDMRDQEYEQMLCVEVGNDPRQQQVLKAGASATMRMVLRCEELSEKS